MTRPSCDVVRGDMLDLLPRWANDGVRFDAIVCDPPYHLASIAKRFSGMNAAPAKHGRDGAAARLSRGFMGSETDAGDVSFQPSTWKACLDVLKPGGRAAVFGGTRTWWKTAAAMDAAGFEIEDTLMWVYGQGLVLRRSRLKPCWEPIILGRAPGGGSPDLNIDETRTEASGRLLRIKDTANATYSGCMDGSLKGGSKAAGVTDVGRWPSNLIHDGSDEVVSCFPDAPGQIADARTDGSPKSNPATYGAMRHRDGEASRDKRYADNGGTNFAAKPGARRTDSGSAARFFTECRFDEDEKRILYHGKASSGERVFHCGVCGENAFRAEREAHAHGRDGWDHLIEHPTVKPVSLLEHIVKLLCPPGGLVLDCFAGTGSTGVAAVRAGRNAVLVERDANHARTCAVRLAHG